MATSLRITTKIRNDTDKWERGEQSVSVTTTGDHLQLAKHTIGTSEESITIASYITGGEGPGFCHIYNSDATNYVQIGISTGAYFGKLKAGESACLRLDAGVTTLYLKANTAACKVEVLIYES